MAAKLAGSFTNRSSHSFSRSINKRRVWSTTAEGDGTVGPFGRRRLPSRGFRSFCSSDSIRTSIARPLRNCFSLDVLANPNLTKISVSPHLGIRPILHFRREDNQRLVFRF